MGCVSGRVRRVEVGSPFVLFCCPLPPRSSLPSSCLVQVVGRQRPVQRFDDARHGLGDPLHLGLGVEARHDGVEPRREAQVVERFPFFADRVLGIDLGALDVALFDGLFDLGEGG